MVRYLIILLLCFGVDNWVYANDLNKQEFDHYARTDLEQAYKHCMKRAYDESTIDALKARTEAGGYIVSRIQVRVMLYTACMHKVYEADFDRILKSLPTDGA